MDFWEVVRTRRGIREFSPEPVSAEVLERVLDCARQAPSANNVQPWRVIAVRDANRRREIAHLCFEQDFIAQAPVVLVVCGQRYTDSYSWIGPNMHLVDTAIFTDHLMLAARAEGLGTCWVGGFDAARHGALKTLLSIPESHDAIMVVPIGYPARDNAFRPCGRRKALAEILTEETFRGD